MHQNETAREGCLRLTDEVRLTHTKLEVVLAGGAHTYAVERSTSPIGRRSILPQRVAIKNEGCTPRGSQCLEIITERKKGVGDLTSFDQYTLVASLQVSIASWGTPANVGG